MAWRTRRRFNTNAPLNFDFHTGATPATRAPAAERAKASPLRRRRANASCALQEPGLAAQCGSWTLGVCDDEYKAWTGCLFTTSFAQNGLDCQVDCDAVIGTPSRPSTLPPTMPTRPPTGNDSDGALGLTTTLTAAAVAVAAAF